MIIKKEVEHIARLARIEASENDIVKFEKDLEGILEFVGQLKEADTAGVEPMLGGSAAMNQETLIDETRSDEILPPIGNPAELVNAAPRKKEGWIEVEAVL